MNALRNLVNFCPYGGEALFFDEGYLYDVVGKDVARDLIHLVEQLCQENGTAIDAILADEGDEVRHKPLRYKAIPRDDLEEAILIASNNVLVAAQDLDWVCSDFVESRKGISEQEKRIK